MLILMRRANESIRIGNRVRVTVLGVKGCQVRLGIEAPPDTDVDREEVWERKKAASLRSRTTPQARSRTDNSPARER